MNDRLAWPPAANSHQYSVKHELAGYCLARRPPDNHSGEQVHDHCEVEPALPRSNVRNIGNPSHIRARDVEVALQDVWDELRSFGGSSIPGSIAPDRSDLVCRISRLGTTRFRELGPT